ncbi:hypothetical protein CSAL01_12875 [Colletotrichum salicis]|uniref:Major facilitator superfamily (MFS) profile domain-containing protein n=1 Tax=Colletotrichum salicis TaxID=1209931 RepID=A0A135U6L6_9PEZI|nr:hypothetical protein CSAL01_12875 [Colletotrichum salicis]
MARHPVEEASRRAALLHSAMPSIPWYKQSHLLKLNFSLFSLILFSSAIGYDSSMTNGLLALPMWNSFMGHPTGAWLGFINCIYVVGIVLTLPVCPLVVNSYGRKIGIWFGFIFLFLGMGLQAGASSVPIFILGRFFLGMNTGWYTSAAPLLITEIAYPPHRGIVSSLYNCGWYVGAVVAAWITFATRNMSSDWSWRIPSLLQALLPIIALPGFMICPESPRWLISVQRQSDARATLASAHAGGDLASPLVDAEVIEIEAAIQAEEAATKSTSYAQLFRGKGNRHRLLISVTLGFFSQWTGVGVVSYYLAIVLQTVGITSVTHQTLITACLQIWNLIWASGAACLVDKAGRRMLFIASGAIMLVAYIIVTALSGSFAYNGSSTTGLAVIPFLFIYYAGYDISLYVEPCLPRSLGPLADSLVARSTTWRIYARPYEMDVEPDPTSLTVAREVTEEGDNDQPSQRPRKQSIEIRLNQRGEESSGYTINRATATAVSGRRLAAAWATPADKEQTKTGKENEKNCSR